MNVIGRMLIMVMLFVSVPAVYGANSEKNFGGVGIDGAPLADGRIRVTQLVTGGPAHLAGIKGGDIITHIDGKPTQGSDFQAMVAKRLRGQAGTAVTIKVQRDGEPKPLTFTLVRQQLVIGSSSAR